MKIYRATVVTGDDLAVVFVVIGVLGVIFGKEFQVPLFISIWSIVLGSGILVGSRLSRYELTDSGITRINCFGRRTQTFAWSDIDELTSDGEVNVESDRYFKFSLHSKGQTMSFRDDIPGWAEIQTEINQRLAHVSPQNEVIPTGYHGRPPEKLRKHRLAVGTFVTVWLILFCSFGYLSQSSVRHHEDLYRTPDGWVVRYRFSNTSVMNSIEFEIEKTWLNGVPPKSDSGNVKVSHRMNDRIDVLFPLSAAKLGTQATLHSWWQWSTGSTSGFHMQELTTTFGAKDEPLPIWHEPQ